MGPSGAPRGDKTSALRVPGRDRGRGRSALQAAPRPRLPPKGPRGLALAPCGPAGLPGRERRPGWPPREGPSRSPPAALREAGGALSFNPPFRSGCIQTARPARPGASRSFAAGTSLRPPPTNRPKEAGAFWELESPPPSGSHQVKKKNPALAPPPNPVKPGSGAFPRSRAH